MRISLEPADLVTAVVTTVLEIQDQMIACRLEAKVTRIQLAEKMGVPVSYVGRWERGDVDVTIRRLHQYFWELGWDVRISLEPMV